MKAHTLTLVAILSLATPAFAEVINLRLGQSTVLEKGDVAIISHAGYTSSITCASHTPPAQEERMFPGEYVVNLGGVIPFACRVEEDMPEVRERTRSFKRQAALDAERKCLRAGFTGCRVDESSYTLETFPWGTGRDIGCRVTATARGIRHNN